MNLVYCGFCGKSQFVVRKIITGPNSNICDECVALCDEVCRKEIPAYSSERDPTREMAREDERQGRHG